jgi:hypothetical protein
MKGAFDDIFLGISGRMLRHVITRVVPRDARLELGSDTKGPAR